MSALTALLDRRALLAGLAALASSPAVTQPVTAFRAVTIDTATLADRGASRAAAAIRTQLVGEVPAALAGRVTGARNAPTLVVRVTSLSLAAFAGGGGGGAGGRDGAAATDYLEGEALIVPPGGGAPTARVPLLSAVPSDSAGAWYAADFDQRRLAYLTSHFAGWLARKV